MAANSERNPLIGIGLRRSGEIDWWQLRITWGICPTVAAVNQQVEKKSTKKLRELLQTGEDVSLIAAFHGFITL